MGNCPILGIAGMEIQYFSNGHNDCQNQVIDRRIWHLEFDIHGPVFDIEHRNEAPELDVH